MGCSDKLSHQLFGKQMDYCGLGRRQPLQMQATKPLDEFDRLSIRFGSNAIVKPAESEGKDVGSLLYS